MLILELTTSLYFETLQPRQEKPWAFVDDDEAPRITRASTVTRLNQGSIDVMTAEPPNFTSTGHCHEATFHIPVRSLRNKVIS